jgi:hypothetical protein
MPNGVELAREAKRLNDNIKILLTSGYAGDLLKRLPKANFRLSISRFSLRSWRSVCARSWTTHEIVRHSI